MENGDNSGVMNAFIGAFFLSHFASVCTEVVQHEHLSVLVLRGTGWGCDQRRRKCLRLDNASKDVCRSQHLVAVKQTSVLKSGVFVWSAAGSAVL